MASSAQSTSPVVPEAPPGLLKRRILGHPAWLIAPALLLLVLTLGVPLLLVVIRSFSEPDWGLQNYIWFYNSQTNLMVLRRTFVISAWVTLVCVLVGYPYAYVMTAVGPNWRLVLILCVLVPFWVSGVVRTLAWVILLQDTGVINNIAEEVGIGRMSLIRTQTGVIIGMVQVLLPFMILPLYSVMKAIDLRLIRAASSLGASPVRSFLQVYLPLSLPGVYAGATIVFILALGFYITPALLGGRGATMLSSVIQTQIMGQLNWGRGGAMGVILLLATFLLLAIAAPLMRQSHKQGTSR